MLIVALHLIVCVLIDWSEEAAHTIKVSVAWVEVVTGRQIRLENFWVVKTVLMMIDFLENL